MDKLVFPDKVLNNQICSVCLNYLSVGPVSISLKDQIVCGRCSTEVTAADGEELKSSFYNSVAEQLIFKCINHYEGCDELLYFNEAREHEKNCQTKGIMCPSCSFKGNGCQLVYHLKVDHPEELAKEDTFKLVANKEKSFNKLVIVQNSRILCMAISVSDAVIRIFNCLLTPARSDQEHFVLRLFKTGSSSMQFVTQPIRITHDRTMFPSSSRLMENAKFRKNCFVLDRGEIVDCFPSGWCLGKVEIADDTEKEQLRFCNSINKKASGNLLESVNSSVARGSALENVKCLTSTPSVARQENLNSFDCVLEMSESDLRTFVNNKFPLWRVCSSCNVCVVQRPFHLCTQYHMSCPNCIEKECPKCDAFDQWINTSRIDNLTLKCRWTGCQSAVNIFDYMIHKRECKFRQYKCPGKQCGFAGPLDRLIRNHWHLSYVESAINGVLVDIKARHHSFYLQIHHNELYHITTRFDYSTGKFSLIIYELDVTMSKSYNIELYFSDEPGVLRKAEFSKVRVRRTIYLVTRVLKEDETKTLRIVWSS